MLWAVSVVVYGYNVEVRGAFGYYGALIREGVKDSV